LKKEFFTSKLWSLKKAGLSQPIERRVETIEGEKFTWTNLQNPERKDIELLAQKYHFNVLNIEDCMTKFELPKIDSYDDHVFVILHFPPLATTKSTQQFTQLSIFVGSDFLVTIHQGDLKPLVDMVNICKENSDPQRRQRLIGKSTGSLLHEIIDVLVDDLLHTIRKIVGNLEDIEDIVFDETKTAGRQISVLRREITKLRRIVTPLKRITLETAKNLQRFSKSEEDLTLYFDDIIDHVDKVIESLEESKETLEIYKDTDFMLSTEKSNKILSVLTMIFTLSIPATVITQFYGMNVNIPGGIETGTWLALGPYTTFIFVIFICSIPALVMWFYFRRLGWFTT
jgi:magnesium transporter